MTHTQKIIKVGNSLAVTIPSPLVKTLGLKAKDSVLVVQKDAESITYKFLSKSSHLLNGFYQTTSLIIL